MMFGAVVLAFFGGICAAAGLEAAPSGRKSKKDRLPRAFRQILPRGRIASVDHPRFVTAEEADIDDDAWVLGVVVDGQARAYSLNLLNRHEVVNDEVNGKPFAAVW